MTTLSEFNDLAYRAHTGTSFSPEKRRDSVIREHEDELNVDLQQIPSEEHERYIFSYKKYFSAWLSAKSNCISSMITGPARFPVRRAEKANATEHNRYNEFVEWRQRALSAIKKKQLEARPQKVKDDEEFNRICKHINYCAAVIIGIDNGTERGCSRALFVNSLVGKINTAARHGNAMLVKRLLEHVLEINAQGGIKKPVLGKSHSVWKLMERANAKIEQQAEVADKESNEIPFDTGKVILNYQSDRLQICYDSKPPYSVIAELKKNAFKWSPSNMAWQRQLTNAAAFAANKLTGLKITI